MRYEVGKTSDKVRHSFYPISFTQSFANAPSFIATMQTTDGGDTANLRWQNKGSSNVEVKVMEEQSKDSEIKHTTEVVGYIAISAGD